jgi:hypothetical protein
MDRMRELELYEFLSRSLSVDITMDTEYECGREYATCCASVRIRHPETGEWQELASGYDSVCINRD